MEELKQAFYTPQEAADILKVNVEDLIQIESVLKNL